MIEKKNPPRNCFQGGLNFVSVISPQKDKPILHNFLSESNCGRPFPSGCTKGTGKIHSVGDACEEQEPGAFELQVSSADQHDHQVVIDSQWHGEQPRLGQMVNPGSMPGKGEVRVFEEFWKEYPRKVGKGKARDLWKRKKPNLQKCLESLEWQKQTDQWKKDGGAYIPHPSTWIAQERWDDEAPTNGSEPPKKDICAICKGVGLILTENGAIKCQCQK